MPGITSGPTSPTSFELPSGEYIVEAVCLPQLDWHGRLYFLTPGEYRLVVELAGGRCVERALVLLPGETVEVRVAFADR